MPTSQDASQKPAQRSVEQARLERLVLRAKGLERRSDDDIVRLKLADRIQQENAQRYQKRLEQEKSRRKTGGA